MTLDVSKKVGFSNYRDISVAYLALYSYSELNWISNKAGATATDVKNIGRRVLESLDGLEPIFKCKYSKGCDKKAARMGFQETGPRIKDKEPHYVCGEEHLELDKPHTLYDLAFKSSGRFQVIGQRLRQLHRYLREAHGFEGKLTEESAQKFINDLVKEE